MRAGETPHFGLILAPFLHEFEAEPTFPIAWGWGDTGGAELQMKTPKRISRVLLFALLFVACWVAVYSLLDGWVIEYDAFFSTKPTMPEEYEARIREALPAGTPEPKVREWLVAQKIPYQRKRDEQGNTALHGEIDLHRRWFSCPTGHIYLDFSFDEQDRLTESKVSSCLYSS
jgi:hypothetical protein